MKLSQLHIENFKSFDVIDIKFADLSLIIGANAAGKSNLISAFRFISDIIQRGVENAISLQGGFEYLVNTRIGKTRALKFEFVIETFDKQWYRFLKNKEVAMSLDKITYKFQILPFKRRDGYTIETDELTLSYIPYQYNSKAKNASEKFVRKSSTIEATIWRTAKKDISTKIVSSGIEPIDMGISKISYVLGLDLLKDIVKGQKNDKELILNRVAFILPPVFLENGLIKIYDFDPKRLKKPCSITSTKKLEEDGSNIAAVIKEIMKNPQNSKQLTILLQSFLPSIEKIDIVSSFDQSFSFKMKEMHSPKMFYSYFLSDGTVSIVAIILALFFEKDNDIIILEEPERNIHPQLFQLLIERIKEVSKRKQIIITTHNAQIVKFSDLESIRFLKRDQDGNSIITSPKDNEVVKCFLANELGMDDLFIQNILE